MLPKQLFIGPLAYPVENKDDGAGSLWKKDVFSLKNLEFQVAGGCGVVRRSPLSKEEKEEKRFFTTSQIQQLLFQIYIFRHITSCLPAPLQVFFLFRRVVIFNPGDLDHHTSMMDPEPKRCRRTDGKRWRCYLDALDDQKYCARHMHRGSHRSRKHVEVSQVDLNSNQVDGHTITSRLSSSITSPRVAETISESSALVSTGLHLGVPSSYYNGSVPRNLPTGSPSFSCNSSREEKGEQSTTPVCSFGTLDVQEKTGKESNCDHLKGGFSFFDQTITSHKSRCNQQNNNNNPDVSVAPPGLCSSPKSVCQTYTGSMNFDNKAGTMTETVRCQRTDGKRWQCKKNAVANEKYCESHLHRGAKRTKVDSKMHDHNLGITLASAVGIPKNSENDRNLNTDLTISLAGNSGILTVDTSSNSSSDATTVTDENVDVTFV